MSYLGLSFEVIMRQVQILDVYSIVHDNFCLWRVVKQKHIRIYWLKCDDEYGDDGECLTGFKYSCFEYI